MSSSLKRRRTRYRMTLGLVDVHITTTLLFSTVHTAIGGGGGGGISINIMHTLANSVSLAHDISTPSISILSEIAGDVHPNSITLYIIS